MLIEFLRIVATTYVAMMVWGAWIVMALCWIGPAIEKRWR